MEERKINVHIMEFLLQFIISLVLYIECFIGITLNITIVIAKYIKWRTLKSFQTCDKILSCLAISRTLYLLNEIIFEVILEINPWWLDDIVVLSIIFSDIMFLYYTNLWFATVLCVFYCVKITSYNWKFLNFLKTKISTLVPWLLLTSLVISVIFSLPSGCYIYGLLPQNVDSELHDRDRNISKFVDNNGFDFHVLFWMFFTGSIPSFLIFCVANCLLIHSLVTHTRRVRSSGSGFQSPNLDSHLSAVKSMSFFLLLQTLFFLCMIVSTSFLLIDSQVLFFINSIVMCCSPVLHSLYIILSSSEMKKTVLSLFFGLMKCSFSEEQI
ncbi:taste receptor type 2 member 9-like [Rhinoderma darwinii]|uniref:taste receptor type 2 member 9-like n=1 Tax=Rhinoderma darwinii TaxID=43563 RepID=UPI003F672F70